MGRLIGLSIGTNGRLEGQPIGVLREGLIGGPGAKVDGRRAVPIGSGVS